jgi:hypothetical protein
LLGFRIETGDGPVTVDLKLNGKPVSISAISLGRNGAHPEGRPFVVPDTEADQLFPAEFVESGLGRSTAAGARIVVVRLADPLESMDADSGPGHADDLERQLRALGYVE